GGNSKWIAASVAALLLVGGGGFWAYTAHRSSSSGIANSAVPAPQPQTALPAAALPSADKTEPAPQPAAGPAPAGGTQPAKAAITKSTAAPTQAVADLPQKPSEIG